MVPAVFCTIGIEAEFFKAGIFVFFEIFGIVEPPINAIEELRNSDGSEACVIVGEFGFFVSSNGVARFVKPFGGSKIEGADALELVGCESKKAVPDFGRTAGERDEQERRTANACALDHASNEFPGL